jgi:ribonucleoside-diphosphate reductase alpha chain
MKLWERIEASGSGEPGMYLTNNSDWGTNPCCEIALRPNQFCNLTEINLGDNPTQEEFEARSKAAAFLGTLQASYTDFHYLRDIWRKNTEKDALLGVSMTGIASAENMYLDYVKGAKAVIEENKRIAAILGINSAARTTAVKPAGTTSLVLGTSSGIHAWHNDYYIRRIRLGKNEAIYTYLSLYHPELIEDEFFSPTTQAVVSVPQKAPEGAITRHEHVIELLERVKLISEQWVKTGHVKGENTHNVSCTVSVKEKEWPLVGDWMWENRESYNGLSVLPMDGGTYKQLPFEDITEEQYNELVKTLTTVDLSKIVEVNDTTNLNDQAACAGGACEVK